MIRGSSPDAGRTLLVISAQPEPDLAARIASGVQPRRDYFELARALDADLLFPADVARDPVGRLLVRAGALRVALAWVAFRRRHRYDAVYSDGEGVGLPLAALLKLARAPRGRPRHVMLTHYLSPWKKRMWFRLGVQSHLDAVICHASAQRERLITELGVPAERALLLPYFADQRYWSPDRVTVDSQDGAAPAGASGIAARPLICAVGLEFRDYGTLLAAADGLAAEVVIAAASHWSHHSAFAGRPTLPENVRVAGYDYPALRQLYARSRFVVVPLREGDNQAGVTVILEAMALGKAVIVSGTRGQTDVVRDRRNGGRGRMPRQWWPGFVDAPDVADRVGHLPTGFYVTPGDAGELRRAMQYLLDHPDVAAELGANGRRVVAACFTLDAFVRRFAAVIRGAPQPEPVPLA
jgi:glycosyltransferase involved in cell wall biosynthesis